MTEKRSQEKTRKEDLGDTSNKPKAFLNGAIGYVVQRIDEDITINGRELSQVIWADKPKDISGVGGKKGYIIRDSPDRPSLAEAPNYIRSYVESLIRESPSHPFRIIVNVRYEERIKEEGK